MSEAKPALPPMISLPWKEALEGQEAAKEERRSCLWQKQTSPHHSHPTKDGKTSKSKCVGPSISPTFLPFTPLAVAGGSSPWHLIRSSKNQFYQCCQKTWMSSGLLCLERSLNSLQIPGKHWSYQWGFFYSKSQNSLWIPSFHFHVKHHISLTDRPGYYDLCIKALCFPPIECINSSLTFIPRHVHPFTPRKTNSCLAVKSVSTWPLNTSVFLGKILWLGCLLW